MNQWSSRLFQTNTKRYGITRWRTIVVEMRDEAATTLDEVHQRLSLIEKDIILLIIYLLIFMYIYKKFNVNHRIIDFTVLSRCVLLLKLHCHELDVKG